MHNQDIGNVILLFSLSNIELANSRVCPGNISLPSVFWLHPGFLLTGWNEPTASLHSPLNLAGMMQLHIN